MTAPIPNLDALEAIVFDFDGVILESAAIKGAAFEELFADHPQHLASIRAHHLENLGVSRFAKFEWIYENLMHRPLSAAESESLGQRYSALVMEKTATSPFVPGALEALQSLSQRLPLFVASATPQEELSAVVRRRQLESYFVSVHGTPPAKAALLSTIIESGAFAPDRVLMIGDGVSDLDAAESAGCSFLARLDDKAPPQPFPDDVTRIRTLHELPEVLS